jgi:hypothetical protein
MTSISRLLLAFAATAAPLVATAQRAPVTPTSVPFDSVFRLVSRVPLTATAQEPIGVVPFLAVRGNTLYVVDRSNGNLKLFDLAKGTLTRTVGRSGNGPGEMRRVTGIVVDSSGAVTTVDGNRKVLTRRDPSGKVIDEVLLVGNWQGVAHVEVGAQRRLVLIGRTGLINRADGTPLDAAPPILHEMDSTRIARSFTPVEWPLSAWQRSFTNFFSSAAGSTVALGTFATNVVRFRDWSTNREWSDTLRASWLKPIDWPKNEQFGQGNKMQQMDAWVKLQVLVHGLYMGSPRWYVAQVKLHDDDGEETWGYIVSKTDGSARTVTMPVTQKIQALRGDLAYMLTEDESGNYVLEVRRVRLNW